MISSLNHENSSAEADYKVARGVAPYSDDCAVGKMTGEIIARGHSILQIHKLGKDDRDHVSGLLDLFRPPQGALVLDAGCGVGRVAELMAEQRPDLEFILLNISQAQLDLCPARFRQKRADFHATGLLSRSVDAVMFGYSLGHGLLDAALREAQRVLVPDGVLFIYDLTANDTAHLVASLGYRAHPVSEVADAARAAGFVARVIRELPDTGVADFLDLIGAVAYDALFRDVRPVAYRFVKC